MPKRRLLSPLQQILRISRSEDREGSAGRRKNEVYLHILLSRRNYFNNISYQLYRIWKDSGLDSGILSKVKTGNKQSDIQNSCVSVF
jgi:hypothetical protein